MYKTGSRQENLHNGLRACKVEKYIKRVVLLNKTYPTDIKTIVNLKKPTKPNLT